MKKEKIIEKAQKAHGTFYDYSLLDEEVITSEKVEIICPKHGVFKMRLKDHINKPYSRCRGCHDEAKAKSNNKRFQSKFFDIVAERHPSLDFSKVDLKGWEDEIEVVCPKHGSFTTKPVNLYANKGCWRCGQSKAAKNRVQWTKEAIENLISEKFPHIVCIKAGAYQMGKSEVECKKHGKFTANNKSAIHHDEICPGCRYEKSGKKQRSTTEEFVEKAKKVHGDFYDYSKVDYKTTRKKVTIVCPNHGDFRQKPNSHLQGKGCPVCNESKGEKQVRVWLDENGIEYEREKSFEDLIYIKPLRFDFYLPTLNMVIEYDGQQHFEECEYYGSLTEIKARDALKNEYCKHKKIEMIRISYKDNIEDSLTKINQC